MKKLLKVLTLVLVLVLAVSVFVACDDTPDNGGSTGDNGGNSGDSGNGGNSGNGGGTSGDASDTGKKYTVTFMYIDKAGNELFTADDNPVSSNSVPNRNWGYSFDGHPLDGDVQAFEDLVIVGWLEDKAAAMAATEETEGLSECLLNIKSDLTLYSVVREKKDVTVTLMNGTEVFDTLTLKEGAALTNTKRPTALGKYFKNWAAVEDPDAEFQSSQDCIYADCTFNAVMGSTDGTIGKVAANTIEVDGVKDAEYASGAYLAHNNKKTSTNALTINELDSKGQLSGTYAEPDIEADTWMLWDGEWIYLLIEVYDKTFTYRSEAYVSSGADAWLNDSIELWYCFEQNTGLKESKTRIGLAATAADVDLNGNGTIENNEKNIGKYALPRHSWKGAVTGIFGGRSTHYEEINYKVRNAYFSTGDDLDLEGVDKPSYIVELQIPAKTEGTADPNYAYKDWDGAKQEPLKDQDLVDFEKTGLKYGCAPNDDVTNYAFTDGKTLIAGDFIRVCLQVNDLRISWEDLANTNKYLDTPTKDVVKEKWGITVTDSQLNASTMLYELVGGQLKAADTKGKFCSTASTQHNTDYYLMFSLNDKLESNAEVWGLGRGSTASTRTQVVMYKDKACTVKYDRQ